MRTATMKLVVLAGVVMALAMVTACKSEIDNKPAATVTDLPADEKAGDKAGEMAGDKKPEEKAEEKPAGDMAAAGAFKLDPATSKVGFIGAKVTGDHKGGFKTFEGTAEELRHSRDPYLQTFLS